MQNKKVLITGASGFLGYYLVNTLMYANDAYDMNCVIILLVRNINRFYNIWRTIFSRQDIRFIIQDIRDEIINSFNADLIIHAATTSDSKKLKSNGFDVIDAAINGTKNIIQYALKSNVESIVYVSSITVYGNCNSNPVIEDCCGNEKWDDTLSCYTYGKRVSEYLMMEGVKNYGLLAKIIRPGYIYGASRPEDSRVYSEIIKNAAYRKDIVLHSSGLTYRPLIYVMDVVDAILRVLLLGKKGEAYNTPGNIASILEFANCASEISGLKVTLANKETSGSSILSCPSYSTKKIQDHCEWKANVSLREGVLKSVDIYNHQFRKD